MTIQNGLRTPPPSGARKSKIEERKFPRPGKFHLGSTILGALVARMDLVEAGGLGNLRYGWLQTCATLANIFESGKSRTYRRSSECGAGSED